MSAAARIEPGSSNQLAATLTIMQFDTSEMEIF